MLLATRALQRLMALLCLVAGVSACGTSRSPGVEFVHDERADADCAERRQTTIQPKWAEELRSRLPEFRALWAANGPAMIDAVARLTGKTLAVDGRQVKLSLCDLPSQAITGISVNMRFALRSFSPAPVPMRVKVDTAFHELLHGFVATHTPARSPLLARHSREPTCVRNHLHLLALQKAVLLSLGAAQELQQLRAVDEQLPSSCYRRAWAIVDGTEGGHTVYVEELALGSRAGEPAR